MKKIIIFIPAFLLLFSCSLFKTAKTGQPEEISPEAKKEAARAAAEEYVDKGIAYHQQGKDSLAVAAWNKALRLIPDDAEVYNFKGIALHKTGALDSALVAFKKAVELNPAYFEAWNNIGYILFLKNDYSGAMQAVQQALKINPSYEPALKNKKLIARVMAGQLSKKVFELTEKKSRHA